MRGNRSEEIAQAEATATALRAAFEEAKNGPRRQEIEQAQADYKAASADATNAKIFYDRMEKLIAADTISRQQFDDAREKRDAAALCVVFVRFCLVLFVVGSWFVVVCVL